MKKETKYVTTDLVIRTNHGKDQLVIAFEKSGYCVDVFDWDEEYVWLLNVGCSCQCKSPELCIQKYCNEINTFPTQAKEEWENAEFKEFSIGYHAAETPHCYESHLPSETVKNVTSLGAGIGIAIYPAPDEGTE